MNLHFFFLLFLKFGIFLAYKLFVSVFHFLFARKKNSLSLVEEPLLDFIKREFRLYRIRCVIKTGDWIKFVWFISFYHAYSSNQHFLFSCLENDSWDGMGWDGMRVSGPGHLGPTLRAWNSRGSCSRSLEMDHEWILLVTKNVIDGHWELLDLESNLLKLRRRSQQIASWIKLYVVLNQKSYWLSSGYRTAGQDLMIWSKLLGFGTKGNRKQTRK